MFGTGSLSNKDDFESEDKISIDLNLQSFKCPISDQIFLEPVITAECKHKFERSSIEEWCKGKAHPTCPICRKELDTNPQGKNNFISADPLIAEIIQALADKNPKINDERYFNIHLFNLILEQGNSDRLRNMINVLRSSAKLLNQVVEDEKSQGTSPLYHLVTHKNGLSILSSDSALRKNINSIHLNALLENGVNQGKSILYLLVSNESGRQLLLKDPLLRSKITYESLNRIIQIGIDKNLSVLHWLINTESGRQILLKDSLLLGKIPFDKIKFNNLTNTASGQQILIKFKELQSHGKYIFEHGFIRLNPVHIHDKKNSSNEGLALISSINDILAAMKASQEAKQKTMQVSRSTITSINMMQSKHFIDEFQLDHKIDNATILENISECFEKYSIPIGLLNKLLLLKNRHINIMISDDDAMNKPYHSLNNHTKMTRWNALENRISQLIDLLTFIPTASITISFLNRKEKLVLKHQGELKKFQLDALINLKRIFQKPPAGDVPLFAKFSEMKTSGNTMHYFYLDKPPTDINPLKMTDLLRQYFKTRKQPEQNPITFINCSEEPQEWLQNIQGLATAVIDDFGREKSKVRASQGVSFPYSEGFWLICQLVGAINQNDLLFSTEFLFKKPFLDNLLGRVFTNEEYRHYFDTNPKGQLKDYQSRYEQFAKDDISIELDSHETEKSEDLLRRELSSETKKQPHFR